jgi:hypothetical protein
MNMAGGEPIQIASTAGYSALIYENNGTQQDRGLWVRLWVEKMVRHADFWAGPLNDTGYWARIGKTTHLPGNNCARFDYDPQ